MSPTEFLAELRKRKKAPAYFLRGPDRFLHEMCRAALENAVGPEAREWCWMEIEFKPGGLAKELDGANQMPMLGGLSYFYFSDPEDFEHATDDDLEALQAYLEQPSPFATVVFAAGEPDRRRKFIHLLEKKAEVVELRPVGRRDAAVWARDFLRQAGVELSPELAEEIAAQFQSTSDREPERGGVNLLWMRTELEKVLTAKPGIKRLDRQDLDLIVAFREEHQISGLLRAIAERKYAEALERLRALLSSKTAETLLLWCIADLARQALKLQGAPGTTVLRRSASYGGRPAEAGGWGRPGSEIPAIALENYSQDELRRVLQLARRADLGIKSSWKDSKILLEFLVWQIAAAKAATPSEPGWDAASTQGDDITTPSTEE